MTSTKVEVFGTDFVPRKRFKKYFTKSKPANEHAKCIGEKMEGKEFGSREELKKAFSQASQKCRIKK